MWYQLAKDKRTVAVEKIEQTNNNYCHARM